MKLVNIIALILALFIASAVLMTSCGGEPEEIKKDTETTEKPIDFESIDVPETEESETEAGIETAEPETEAETEESEPNGDGASSGVGLDALLLAKKLIGTKFKFGGTGPDEFDNSGFIYYIFKESGVEVPRLARDMHLCGRDVSRADIAPGDILVFANEIGGGAEFVGIYAGDGQFIACNNPDSPTKLQPIGNYWEARFISARRVG